MPALLKSIEVDINVNGKRHTTLTVDIDTAATANDLTAKYDYSVTTPHYTVEGNIRAGCSDPFGEVSLMVARALRVARLKHLGYLAY